MLVLLAGLAQASPEIAFEDQGAQLPLSLSHDALWNSYLRFFEPQELPADNLPDPMCGTVLVQTLKDRWDEFSPTEKARITGKVAPFLPDLKAPMLPKAAPPNGQLPPPGGQVCWGAYLPNEIHSAHFSVEWESGALTQADAQELSDELEFSYQTEVQDLGWREPKGMDEYLLPVYVVNNGSASGYTTVSPCDGEDMPYIVTYEAAFFDNTWWMDMQSHEFNHASQFSYGYAMEFWFWEATATYMEEYVYPTHNGWSPYVYGYSEQPYIAMSASDQVDYGIFLHMYGMSIWNFWIDENYGGLPAVLGLWEYSDTVGGQYSLTPQEAIEGIGLDFSEVFKGFTAANAVMDYEEHYAFPGIATQDEVDDLPADGDSSSSTEPEAYGSNYIQFNLDAPTLEKQDLEFTFSGGEAANWLVQLVGANDNQVETVVELELLESEGVGRLEKYGQYDDVYAVISPRKEETGGFDYSWAAAGAVPLVDETGAGTGTDGGGDATGTPTTVEGEGKGGLFGCDASGGSAHLAGWGAALALLATRRRR